MKKQVNACQEVVELLFLLEILNRYTLKTTEYGLIMMKKGKSSLKPSILMFRKSQRANTLSDLENSSVCSQFVKEIPRMKKLKKS